MSQDNFYSVEDAAEAMNFSPQYVRKLLRDDKLGGMQIGKTWVIPMENVDSFDKSEHHIHNTEVDRKSSIKVKTGVPKVLSFFSGAMGLDLGLEKAGFQTLLTCEIDKSSRKTIICNNPKIGLIGDIRNYTAEQVLNFSGLTKKDTIELMAGGPPCQAFSTAGNRKGFEDERGNVFLKYLSLIEELKPQYIVLENVRGILSTKYSLEVDDEISVSFSPELKDTPGSALYYIVKRLEKAGYNISFNLYNSANFGAPQIRERVIIIGCLANAALPFLNPTHSETSEFGLKKWKTFKQASSNLENKCEHVTFPEKRLKFYRMLTAGQNWKDLPIEEQKLALGKSYFLGGGKTGFFRRIAWDRPAPTVVTHPAMPATDLAHPVEDRPLSVQEYKRIQEFPDSWHIEGSILEKYRQIGNAVPVSLGEAVGKLVYSAIKGFVKQPIKDFKYSRYKNTSNELWLKEFQKQVEITKKKMITSLSLQEYTN